MQTYDYNGTPLHLVPHEPDNGYQLFVSFDGTIGLRINRNGKECLQNAIPTTWPNSANLTDANRKQRYLMYKQAWGNRIGILVSHAVYLAWSGKPIPPGYQIHHLNGITTDNCIDNLFCVFFREHHAICDVRQKALKTVVPNCDLRGFDYTILRELQDPRTMSDADFESRMEYLRFMRSCDFDPRIFNAADFHHFFSMPFEDFKTFFRKY